MSDKLMAIMKDVGFGMRDSHFVMLWFTAYDTESSASLQCIPAEQAIELLKKHGISDIKNLEGKPCWIRYENGLVKFVDLIKI